MFDAHGLHVDAGTCLLGAVLEQGFVFDAAGVHCYVIMPVDLFWCFLYAECAFVMQIVCFFCWRIPPP